MAAVRLVSVFQEILDSKLPRDEKDKLMRLTINKFLLDKIPPHPIKQEAPLPIIRRFGKVSNNVNDQMNPRTRKNSKSKSRSRTQLR